MRGSSVLYDACVKALDLNPDASTRTGAAAGQCVAAFDHFCPLLATAVGDLNHARFWCAVQNLLEGLVMQKQDSALETVCLSRPA